MFLIKKFDLIIKILIIILFMIIPGPEKIPAQDFGRFGRNKIQYETFDFKILKTEHFDIYNYSEDKETIQEAALLLEKWYFKYAALLGYSFTSRQPIIIYTSHPDFQQTNVITGLISGAVGGVTESLADRIILPLTGYHQTNEHVLAHELVHAFMFRMQKTAGNSLAGGQFPLWFAEGMSEFLSLGEQDVITAMWLRDAVLYDDLPSLNALNNNPDYSPYHFGQAVWAYFVGRFGKEKIIPLLDALNRQGFNSAFNKVFDVKLKDFLVQWQTDVKAKYEPLLTGKDKAEAISQKLIAGKAGINIGPVISPDGKYVAFFSQRELFTIDLYLADAQTGKIIKKLASDNTDAHFDALRFTEAAGTWSPDSRSFAFVVLAKGNNQIAITDIASLKVKEQIIIREIDAIHGLDWSPDGNRLVLAGLKNGITNLYEYEFSGKTLSALTNERFSVLHPTWSPDGQTIAFVTDRQGEPMAKAGGQMKIALMNRADRNMRLLSLAEGINHTNPQFSPDGQNLYFVSDATGITNLFRYSFQTQNFFKLTNLATGISGFTLLSPALSVSRGTGRIAFTVFEQRAYYIYAFLDQETAAPTVPGETPHTESRLFSAGAEQQAQRLVNITLPPWEVQPYQFLLPQIDPPLLGELPPFTVNNYFPFLQIVDIGQVFGAASINNRGAQFLLGANLFLEDILSDHELFLSFLLSSNIKNIESTIRYRYLRERLDLGIRISHTPVQFLEINTNNPATNETALISRRLFQEKAELLFQYPLSINRRWELSTGYSFIYYDSQADMITLTDDTLDIEEDLTVETKPPIHLFQGGLAYVGDYTFFGFTEPVSGRRYRYEFTQTIGSLYFLTLRADYRYYQFWRPFTLAFQWLHMGRYLGDAESDYLSPFFIGHPDTVRGYSVPLSEIDECPADTPIAECPRFQKLFGSKLAIFRTELRLPVLGTSELGLIDFPFLPLSVAVFFDAGVAWTDESAPVWKIDGSTDERVPIFSTGLAFRLNVGGIAILQFYLAYPFQSPSKGLQYNLYISPGW